MNKLLLTSALLMMFVPSYGRNAHKGKEYVDLGLGSRLTKYNSSATIGYNGFSDNKTNLELADDVANVLWGGKWRMPSVSEFDELRENCTWTWTTQNGVDGYLITSKKEGFTE